MASQVQNIFSIEPEDIEQEDSKADEVYNVLVNIPFTDPNNSVTGEILQMIQSRPSDVLRIWQSTLRVKGEQAQVAISEYINKATDSDGIILRLTDRNLQLEADIKEKEHTIDEITRGAVTNIKNTNLQFREDARKFEKKAKELSDELEVITSQLRQEQSTNNNLNSELQQLRMKYEEIQTENKKLSENLSYKQQELDKQQSRISKHRDDDESARHQLRARTKDYSQLLDTVSVLRKENSAFETRVSELTEQLNQATDEFREILNEKEAIEEKQKEFDNQLNEAISEKEVYEEKFSELETKYNLERKNEDEIMGEVDCKILEWTDALKHKAQLLQESESKIKSLETDLDQMRRVCDLEKMEDLENSLRARDERILELEDKLNEACEELNNFMFQRHQANDEESQIDQRMSLTDVRHPQHSIMSKMLTEKEMREKAEQNAREKDELHISTLSQLRRVEAGHFGLREALAEIKELRKQNSFVSKDISKLTFEINSNNKQIADIEEENSALKKQFGITEVDREPLRDQRALLIKKITEENETLSNQVERLEDEALELRREIFKLSGGEIRNRSGKVSKSFKSDDISNQHQLLNVMDYSGNISEEIKIQLNELRNRSGTLQTENIKQNDEINRLNEQLLQKDSEILKYEEIVKDLSSQLSTSILEQSDSNEIQNHSEVSKLKISLDQLIARFEVKHSSGNNYDSILYLNSQLSEQSGQIVTLKDELNQNKKQNKLNSEQLTIKTLKLEKLDGEYESLKLKMQEGLKYTPLQIPDGIPVTSKEIIQSLNDHLSFVLTEKMQQDDALKDMHANLTEYKNKFDNICDQQSLLYKDYTEARNKWQEEEKNWNKLKYDYETEKQINEIKIQEFTRLQETLSNDPEEMKRKYAELFRKMTILHVNEKTLLRKYSLIEDSEKHLAKENARLKNNITAMDKTVTERISYLNRFKETATYKISALQNELEDSTQLSEYNKLYKEYQDVCNKYQQTIEREETQVIALRAQNNLKEENDELNRQLEQIRNELLNEKEIRVNAENIIQNLQQPASEENNNNSNNNNNNSNNNNNNNNNNKLVTLEMLHLNEKQRADLSELRLDQSKNIVTCLEERIHELSTKFTQISKLNLTLQETEQDLREELNQTLTKSEIELLKNENNNLKQSEVYLKDECEKLKSISHIAQQQVEVFIDNRNSSEKEINSLKEQLKDLQSANDTAAQLAKLHQRISRLQITEGLALQNLGSTQLKNQQLEAKVLNLHKITDDREQMMIRIKSEMYSKIRKLQNAVQSLKRQLAGSIPLCDQEKFSEGMRSLQIDREQAIEKLKDAREAMHQAQLKQAESELEYQHVQELFQTLKEGSTSSKIRDWHEKIRTYKLKELRLSSKLSNFEYNLSEKDQSQRNLQMMINNLEEELATIVKEKEIAETDWDHREIELENRIAELEKKEIKHLTSKEEEELMMGAMPDITIPLEDQLEHAKQSIIKYAALISEQKATLNSQKKDLEETKQNLTKTEDEILQKEKEIIELQLKMPDIFLSEIQAEPERDYESARKLRVAQTSIDTLNELIKQKDEAIDSYQEKLFSARADLEKLNEAHQDEIKRLSEIIQSENESSLKKLDEFTEKVLQSPPKKKNPNYILIIKEKEELIQNLETDMNDLKKELTVAKKTIETKNKAHKKQYQELESKISDLEQKHNFELAKKEENISQLQKQISNKNQDIEVLEDELSAAKEAANQEPSRVMKNLVHRLRQDVESRDKQLRTLNEALMSVKAELLDHSERMVVQQSKSSQQELSIKSLIHKETAEYKNKIDMLTEKINSLYSDINSKSNEISKFEKENDNLIRQINKLSIGIENEEHNPKEIEILKSKNEKCKTELTRDKKLFQSENNNLKIKLSTLQKEYDSVKYEFEAYKMKQLKSAESRVISQQLSNNEEIAKWEEGKKWQKKFENMKTKFQEKIRESENQQKQFNSLKGILEKSDRERANLQAKFKVAEKSKMFPPIQQNVQKELLVANEEIYRLQEEMQAMEREIIFEKDSMLQELKFKNEQLQNKLDILESSDGKLHGFNEEAITNQIDSLNDQLLNSQKEKLSLNHELDLNKKEILRLKSKIDELELYKAEKPNMGKLESNQKQITDLERAIQTMRRVNEKLQTENDSLKKSQKLKDNLKLTEIQKENRKFRTEIEQQKESLAKSKQEKQSEFETLKKEMSKKSDKIEKSMITDLEQTKQNLEDKTKQMNDLQKDLNKKIVMLQEVKKHLKSAADRENELLKEKESLQEQIFFYDSIKSGDQGHKVLRDKFQQARQEILDFEAERQILSKENAELRKNLKDLNEKEIIENEFSIKTEMERLTADNQRLENENGKLRTELSALEPSFFEEVEDLKFNYKEAVQKNILYEEHLSMLATKFGVPIIEF